MRVRRVRLPILLVHVLNGMTSLGRTFRWCHQIAKHGTTGFRGENPEIKLMTRLCIVTLRVKEAGAFGAGMVQ